MGEFQYFDIRLIGRLNQALRRSWVFKRQVLDILGIQDELLGFSRVCRRSAVGTVACCLFRHRFSYSRASGRIWQIEQFRCTVGLSRPSRAGALFGTLSPVTALMNPQCVTTAISDQASRAMLSQKIWQRRARTSTLSSP